MAEGSPGRYSETADAVQDTAAYEAACTAFFVTTRDRPEAERMAAAVAALLAVRPGTPYSRATELAGLMVLHAKREAEPRWMYPDEWAKRERIKAAGLAVALGELADNGFDVAGTCRGCDRTRRGMLEPLIRRNGRAALLSNLKRKLRCASCSSTAVVLAVVDAPKVPPSAWKPWSDRNRK